MDARWRAVILMAICFALYRQLDSGISRPAGLRNDTRAISANALSPVFGFYAERPTLVTIEGRACGTRIANDCWGPEGKPAVPEELQPAKTLMQVNWQGEGIPYSPQGAYRAVVACTNPDCNDLIQSQRVAVGRRFISCSGAHPHSVYFWSNAIRDSGKYAPAGDFSAAQGKFHFTLVPDDPEAVQVCASHWHSWFVPLP